LFGPPTLITRLPKSARLLRQIIGGEPLAGQSIELTFTKNSYNILNMNSLKQTRLKAGLRQTELAEMTGIKQPMLSRIECGKVVSTPETKHRIEKVLGYIDWLSFERVLISGTFAEAQELVKKLLGIYLGMDHFEKQALKTLLWKYFRHTKKSN